MSKGLKGMEAQAPAQTPREAHACTVLMHIRNGQTHYILKPTAEVDLFRISHVSHPEPERLTPRSERGGWAAGPPAPAPPSVPPSAMPAQDAPPPRRLGEAKVLALAEGAPLEFRLQTEESHVPFVTNPGSKHELVSEVRVLELLEKYPV